MTIDVQNESSGADKEANWLPAPKGPFWAALRPYWPKPEVVANADAQYKKNAEYLKARFVDTKKLGVKTGQGYYKYPNPAYGEPGFLR